MSITTQYLNHLLLVLHISANSSTEITTQINNLLHKLILLPRIDGGHRFNNPPAMPNTIYLWCCKQVIWDHNISGRPIYLIKVNDVPISAWFMQCLRSPVILWPSRLSVLPWLCLSSYISFLICLSFSPSLSFSLSSPDHQAFSCSLGTLWHFYFCQLRHLKSALDILKAICSFEKLLVH